MNHPVTTHARPWWLLVFLIVTSVLSACGGGSSPAPIITAQPMDTSVVVGTAATLSVGATASGIAYEWQSSGEGTTWTPVPGASASSYTTPPTSAADNGRRFRVVVSSASASVTSSAVTLTVTGVAMAPAIAVQPATQSVSAPDPATFVVTATGTAPGYQWQRSGDGGTTWADIGGATAATYATGATTTAMNDQRYRVIVSNASGSAISSSAVLTVNAAPALPVFTAQPAGQSISAGAAAMFTVVATGTPTPTLQWQRSTNNGASWTAIAGATNASYDTGPVTAGQNGESYRAVASNSAGSTTSMDAILTVAASGAPSIFSPPTNTTITAGQAVAFVLGVSGTPTPTVQWQLSTDGGATWNNINGATDPVLNLPAGVPLAYSGRRFRAIATNPSGSVTSAVAVLTVTPSSAPTFQFNLLGFNSGPPTFLLYGGSVRDGAGTIQCSGYAQLADPCPKWKGDYVNGTSLTLTATAWPGFRISGWVGGDCGAPGSVANVTLIIDHNSNCLPQFELIPGSTFRVSAVAAGPWLGMVVEVFADQYGNLVVPDTPRITCGPLASTQVCEVNVAIGASPYTLLRLKALPLIGAPAGQIRWSCSSSSPDDLSPVAQTVLGDDIAIGPLYGDTACSAELVPTP